MIVGELEILLYAEIARLRESLNQATGLVGNSMQTIERTVANTQKVLGGLFAGVSVGVATAWFRGIVNGIDALNDLADATGASIEMLSGLEHVAKRTGTSMDTVGAAVIKLNKNLTEAKVGSQTELVLKAIGVSAKELRDLDPAVALQKTAVALSQFADDGNKARAVQELFGKSIKEVAPLLKDLAEGGELQAKVMKSQAEEAERFNKQMFEMQKSSEDAARTLVMSFLPALNKIVSNFREIKEMGSLGLILKDAAKDLFGMGKMGGDPGAAINRILDDRRELERQLAAAEKDGRARHVRTLKADIDELNQMLAVLRVRQSADVLASSGDAGDAISRKQTPRASIGNIPDAESLKAAARELEKQKELLNEINGLSKDFMETYNRLGAMFSRGAITAEQYQKAVDDLWAKQPAIKKATEDQIKLRKQEFEVAEEARKETENALKADQQAREQFALSVTNQYKALNEQNEMLEAEVKLLGATDKERSIALGLLKNEIELRKQLEALDKNLAFTPEQRAMERERLIDIRARSDEMVRMRAESEEHTRVWNSIDQTAHDVFVNIFEGGSNVFKKLGQTLKASLLDWLYQMTVRKWIFNIGASITGSFASGAAGAAAQGAGSAAITSFGGSALGNLVGGGVGMGGVGGFMNGLGAWGSGGSVTGVLSNPGLYSGAELLGTVAPILGGLALLASLAKSFKGETRAGGQYGYSFDGSSAFNARRGSTVGANGIGAVFLEGPSGGDPNQANALIGVNTAVGGINSRFAALGSSTRVTGFGAGYETSDKGRGGVFAGGTLTGGLAFGESGKGDNYAGTLFESTSTQSPDAKAAWENFTTDLIQASIQALQADATLPESVKKLVKDVNAEALSTDAATQLLAQVDTLIASVSKFKEAVGLMPFDDLQKLSFDAAAALIELAGGIDNLNSQLGSYYQNFYTEEERRAQQLKNITKVLQSANVVVPKTNEEFRALVEQYMAMGESGQQALAALLSVNQAFAELYPLTQDVADAAVDLSSALDDALSALKQSIDAEKERLGIEKAVHQEALAAARAVYEISHSNAQALYGVLPAVAAMGAAQGRAFIANAASNASNTGYLPDASALGDAVSAARNGLGSNNFKTLRDQQFAVATLANDLASLEKISGQQKSIEEQQLDALDAQIKALDDLYDQQETLVKAAQGIDTSVLSVADALAKLTELMFPTAKPTAAGPVMSGGPSTATWNGRAAGTQVGFSIDANGYRSYSDGSGSYLSEGEMDLWRRGLLGNVPMPAFATGTPYVTADGPAFLHEGEAVLPAPVAQRWRDNEGNNSAALISEVRILNSRVDDMAKDVARTRKRIEDISPQGDRFQTNEIGTA